ITLNSVCGYAWCMFGKKNKGADYLPLSSSASIPSLLPSYTLDLVQNIRVVRDEALGWRREGELCVKCLLEMHCGVFSCMGNHLCQAFPHFPYLSHLVSCLCFQLCVILFASCTELRLCSSKVEYHSCD
uniref:Uncharacterized protein n=1 Tax=Castor canadensis TaxID=51338 RepID=A0A8C0XPR1_CASCN